MASAAVGASATTPLAGLDAMRVYNLIVLGDLVSSSEVEGRTFVGGDLSGNSSNYQIRAAPTTGPSVPGLTVVGDVNGSHKNLDNGSGAIVGGNVNSGFNLNGGTQTVLVGGTIQNTNVNQNTVNSNLGQTDPAFVQDLQQQKSLMQTSMTGLSYDLSTQQANSSLTISGNRGTFNAEPVGDPPVAIFNISASDLDKIGEISFNLNGADTAIVNVSGKNIVLNDNFLGNATGLGENVIWNFHEAETLLLTTAWKGSILAPFAEGTTQNYIEGSAVFGSLKQDGEMHLGIYQGGYSVPSTPTDPGTSSGGSVSVPEPGVVGILALGLAGIAVWRRRGRKANA